MEVDYGYHKKSDTFFVNELNYMTHGYKAYQGHVFLGFIPVHPDIIQFGIDIGELHYTACHVFYSPEGWGDSVPETYEFFKIKRWILMFMGIDDVSYYARFRTAQEAVDYFHKIEIYNQQVHNRCFLHDVKDDKFVLTGYMRPYESLPYHQDEEGK